MTFFGGHRRSGFVMVPKKSESWLSAGLLTLYGV